MQKRHLNILILCLLFSFLFVGCTQQKDCDLLEFCQRFNRFYKEEQLCVTTFFRSETQSCSDYHIDYNFFEDSNAMLSLKTDANGTVTSLSLTVLVEDFPKDDAGKEAFISTFIRACAVLENVKTEEESISALEKSGLSLEALDFTPDYRVGTSEKFRYTIFCKAECISLFCDRL